MGEEYAVQAEGLRKQFGEIVAVAGVSVAVRPGELFALVGPDGAGKTTTMRMLCGVLVPDGGTARVAGFDVVREPEQVKLRIGYMPQRFSLYEDLTVAENLRFFADLYEVPRAQRAEREQRLLQFSRLGPFTDRLARDLSGGMRQKLALMCTLIHEPQVLFLDEPTTGVDPVSRRELWRILYSLLGRGVTLFLTTPYMDEAERCQRVALMARGRVMACDAPARLKEQMPGVVFEVRCTPLREGQALLHAVEGVRAAHVFGERLHVWVEEAAGAEERIEAALARGGVRITSLRAVPPSLEDVFVSVLAGEEGGAPER